jgi:predicted component of type VI protein secretion system
VAFMAILFGIQQALVLMLAREDPELLEERMEGWCYRRLSALVHRA